MNLPEILKSLRAALSDPPPKITQAAMAALIGTSRRVYSRMETGNHKFSKRDRLFILALQYLNTHRMLKNFLRWVKRHEKD